MNMVAQQRQHWVSLAQGMQQDIQGYQSLRDLLHEQFHAALRHDAAAMEQVALCISAQAEQLAQSTQVRRTHVSTLLPGASQLSMRAAFALLKPPLQQQMQALWERLETLVQECKAMNVRNCGLIMEQAELMHQVIAGGAPAQEIYGPR